MAKPRPLPQQHSQFDALPIVRITVGPANEHVAVHVAGRLGPGCTPVVCVPGYNRNMVDYFDLVRLGRTLLPEATPLVLVDAKGRGRSSDRHRIRDYTTVADAADLIGICRALGIERAIFLGQGHGGQAVMALAADRPSLIAGTVLIDAGPISDPRGLVRLRTTLHELTGIRGEASLKPMLRRMMANDYPQVPEPALEALAMRTHFVDRRGRLQPLFDPTLIRLLEPFGLDDILVAQWPLFDALGHAPLMMMRTQLTQQLRRETFEEMMRRRRDAEAFVIESQGSPALLDNSDDVQPIVDFVNGVIGVRKAA
ncbi:MAG: alpha/beta fold hydrolase [Devosia sp.]|jgi:pimeloyl-ACP methyl ester carboxylesterase